MKVTRNTPEQLIVEHRSWFVSLSLAAAGLLVVWFGLKLLQHDHREVIAWLIIASGVGLFGLMVLFTRRSQTLFLRDEGKVIVRKQGHRGLHQIEFLIDDIDIATLQQKGFNKGGPKSRIALVIPHGEDAGAYPLTGSYDTDYDYFETMCTINLWLSDPKRR